MNVFSYIRVSGRSQVAGEGPDRQRMSCVGFCATNSLKYLGEFFEAGVSGTIDGMDRPEFATMIEAIVCRRINGEDIHGIVVERMDRLARDLMVQEVLLKQCRENSIKVFAADRDGLIDQASDDGDPTRTLIRQVMGALSQWEKSQTVLKLRKARQAIKARTGHCEGAKPYGNTPVEVCLMKMLKTFVCPDSTLQSVASMLNLHGFRTRAGREFSERSAFRVMKLAGVWTRKEPTEYRLRNLGDKRKVGEINISQQKGQ